MHGWCAPKNRGSPISRIRLGDDQIIHNTKEIYEAFRAYYVALYSDPKPQRRETLAEYLASLPLETLERVRQENLGGTGDHVGNLCCT